MCGAPMPADEPATAFVVDRDGVRLDAAVQAATPRLSRRLVHRLIAEGAVRVNGRPAPKGLRLQRGDAVSLPAFDAPPTTDLAIPVVHVDDRLVVVDKPGGLPGHALDPREHDCVAAFLAARFPETAAVGDPWSSGLVHRLDTGTSGLLVGARTAAVHDALRAAFRRHEIAKGYLAIVAGHPPARLRLDTPLAHDPHDRRRMVPAPPDARAWPACTEAVVLARNGTHALLDVTIHTGVTHQVRVHLAAAGFPVLGDTLYGAPASGLAPGRHALHAYRLTIAAGLYEPPLALRCALPDDLRALAPAGAAID